MSKIKVVAAAGLRVPMAENPHEYIGEQAIEVDLDNVYYRRLLDEGDLLLVVDEPAELAKKGAK